MDIPNDDLRRVGSALGAWAWENIGKSLLSNLKTRINGKWKEYSWGASSDKYKERLLKIHSTTKLLGNPKEIDLGKIFTDVFVLDKVSAFRRLEIEELNRNALDGLRLENYITRLPLSVVLQKKDHLYILGKPGSGKSTFLKSITRECCLGNIDKVPVFVSLRDWVESEKSLIDFIVNEFSICEFPDAKLFIDSIFDGGQAIILFDGLDEVPTKGDARKKTIKLLTEFTKRYSKIKVVVTCRTAATDYSFAQFEYVEIADFNQDQQFDFLKKWYSDSPVLGAQILNTWGSDDNKSLVDLAKTPLLLALFCLAFDETRAIPKRRVELYEEAINALLRKWDSSRGIDRDGIYKSLSHIRKEQLLSKIAITSFEAGSIFIAKKTAAKYIKNFFSELPPEDTREIIDEDVVLKAMEAQHGIFIERAFEIYAFSHLTVHEYFAAKNISENMKEDAFKIFVAKHAADDQWREVLLMLASMLDNGKPLIDALLDVMKEISTKCPEIRLFWAKSLDKRVSSKNTKKIEQETNEKNEFHEELFELMLSVIANIKVLNIDGIDITIPRIVLLEIKNNKSLLEDVFLNKTKAKELAIKYFKLAYLLTECLHLAKLPKRESYIRLVFKSLN